MMLPKLFLFFNLFFINTIYPQSDSLCDVFPLNIGNRWNYYIEHSRWLNEYPAYDETRKGNVIIEVTSFLEDEDFIKWQLQENRDYIVHYTEYLPQQIDTTYSVIENTSFEIWEDKITHQIINVGSSFVFTLMINPPYDSIKIFRYTQVDSLGQDSIYKNITGNEAYFIFVKFVGLVRSHRQSFGSAFGYSNDENLLDFAVGIKTSMDFPKEFLLYQNYPNPFNPSTTISFSIPQSQNVELKVFDLLGNEITSLLNEYKEAGEHIFKFDGSNFSSGIYFYKLITGDFIQTKKMLLVK